MAILVITDGKFFVGEYDMAGSANDMSMEFSTENHDITAYGSGGTRINSPGLMSCKFTAKGVQEFDDDVVLPYQPYDHQLFDLVGGAEKIVTMAREGNAEGDIAYSMQAVIGNYTPIQGAIGDREEWSLDGTGGGTMSRLIRGVVAARGTKSTTGNGTGSNLGPALATNKLYAAIHVFGDVPAGKTLDVVIESDSADTFASATTVLTFTQMSAIGSQWVEVAGPITDTWFRAKWTVSAGGSFPMFVVMAIH